MEISATRWILAHFLAGLAIFSIAYLFCLNIQYAATGDFQEKTAAIDRVAALGLVSSFWLWGWMLTDFFRRRPERSSVAWGWFLVFGNIAAAIVYFFRVWRRRHART